MVASCILVGSPEFDGGLPVGKFCTYRSSSLLDRGKGKGDAAGRLGLGGEPLPLPPVPPAVGSGGSGGSGGLDAGIAGRHSLLMGGAGVSRIGLRSAGGTWRGGGAIGAAGAVAALVLGGLTGLRQG